MNKLCLKKLLGELTEGLFFKIIIILILLLTSQTFLVYLLIALIILLPVLDSLRLLLKLRKLPVDVKLVVHKNINNPVFMYWATYAIFEDYIINLKSGDYYKIQDIKKIDVKTGAFINHFGCVLHITTKDGKKYRLPHKVNVLGFKYYQNLFSYLLQKNQEIEVVDKFWHIND